jgi:type IV secretory pathway component VirB8
LKGRKKLEKYILSGATLFDILNIIIIIIIIIIITIDFYDIYFREGIDIMREELKKKLNLK